MLAPLPDKSSLNPRKSETFSIVAREINASFFCDSINCRERIGSRLGPEGTQLAQENVHRDGSHAVKRKQFILKITRIACTIVQPAQAAAVAGDKRFAVAQ